jgi:hypothetical protein
MVIIVDQITGDAVRWYKRLLYVGQLVSTMIYKLGHPRLMFVTRPGKRLQKTHWNITMQKKAG